MTKFKVVKFYNCYDRYIGWQYRKNTSNSELHTWLKSGNYVIIDNRKFEYEKYGGAK